MSTEAWGLILIAFSVLGAFSPAIYAMGRVDGHRGAMKRRSPEGETDNG